MFIILNCTAGKNGFGNVVNHDVIVNTDHVAAIIPDSMYPACKCLVCLIDGSKLEANSAATKVLPSNGR